MKSYRWMRWQGASVDWELKKRGGGAKLVQFPAIFLLRKKPQKMKISLKGASSYSSHPWLVLLPCCSLPHSGNILQRFENSVSFFFFKAAPKDCMDSFISVQSLSHVQLFVTPWTAARQASLSITNSRSLPKLTPIESVMPSNRLILCHPLLLLPSIFPSIRVF